MCVCMRCPYLAIMLQNVGSNIRILLISLFSVQISLKKQYKFSYGIFCKVAQNGSGAHRALVLWPSELFLGR